MYKSFHVFYYNCRTCCSYSVDVAGDAAASVEKSPPKPVFAPSGEQRHEEVSIGAIGDAPMDAIVDELRRAADYQVVLAARLKVSYSGESSRAIQKDEEIACLKAELASARADLEASAVNIQKVRDEKLSLWADLQTERAAHNERKAACEWAVGLMDRYKAEHLNQVEVLRQRFVTAHQLHEEKLRKMDIEFDEEIYPHLVSSVAERR